MRAMRGGETPVDGNLLGQDRAGDFVQARAAVLFGRAAAHQAEFRGFAGEFGHEARLLGLQILNMRKDFLDDELFGRLSDQLLVIGEIRRCEHILRGRGFQQKTAALRCGFGKNRTRHGAAPCRRKAVGKIQTTV